QWSDGPSGRNRSEPRSNTFVRHRSAARLFRAWPFLDSFLELLTHLIARGVEVFPLLCGQNPLELCLLFIVDLPRLEHLTERIRRALDDRFHSIGVFQVEVGHRLRLLRC